MVHMLSVRRHRRDSPSAQAAPIFPAISTFTATSRRATPGFIEPCLPSPADKPPSGANWIHEIKHDGYRLMARRDPVGIRLLTLGSDAGLPLLRAPTAFR